MLKPSGLGQMSLKDLRALREKVDAAIAEKEVAERAELKRKVQEMAVKAGFSVSELFGATGRGKKGVTPVKYRNPGNPDETWTGRGRKPNWIVKAGGDLERFKI
jgi:DNA-binding protein H-NS